MTQPRVPREAPYASSDVDISGIPGIEQLDRSLYPHGPALPIVPDRVVPQHAIRDPNPYAFIILVAIELSFVFGLLAFKICSRWDAVQTAGATTTMAATFFYARGAILAIGRLIASGSRDA